MVAPWLVETDRPVGGRGVTSGKGHQEHSQLPSFSLYGERERPLFLQPDEHSSAAFALPKLLSSARIPRELSGPSPWGTC